MQDGGLDVAAALKQAPDVGQQAVAQAGEPGVACSAWRAGDSGSPCPWQQWWYDLLAPFAQALGAATGYVCDWLHVKRKVGVSACSLPTSQLEHVSYPVLHKEVHLGAQAGQNTLGPGKL